MCEMGSVKPCGTACTCRMRDIAVICTHVRKHAPAAWRPSLVVPAGLALNTPTATSANDDVKQVDDGR